MKNLKQLLDSFLENPSQKTLDAFQTELAYYCVACQCSSIINRASETNRTAGWLCSSCPIMAEPASYGLCTTLVSQCLDVHTDNRLARAVLYLAQFREWIALKEEELGKE